MVPPEALNIQNLLPCDPLFTFCSLQQWFVAQWPGIPSHCFEKEQEQEDYSQNIKI